MLLKFTEDAWADYCYWQNQDKKTLKRINRLVRNLVHFIIDDGTN